jgi:hypothetical protein
VTEIRFDVDLDHPPERVWRALTDPRHLSGWFLPAEVDPDDSTRLRLRPDRVDGLGGPIDVEVVEAVRRGPAARPRPHRRPGADRRARGQGTAAARQRRIGVAGDRPP